MYIPCLRRSKQNGSLAYLSDYYLPINSILASWLTHQVNTVLNTEKKAQGQITKKPKTPKY